MLWADRSGSLIEMENNTEPGNRDNASKADKASLGVKEQSTVCRRNT